MAYDLPDEAYLANYGEYPTEEAAREARALSLSLRNRRPKELNWQQPYNWAQVASNVFGEYNRLREAREERGRADRMQREYQGFGRKPGSGYESGVTGGETAFGNGDYYDYSGKKKDILTSEDQPSDDAEEAAPYKVASTDSSAFGLKGGTSAAPGSPEAGAAARRALAESSSVDDYIARDRAAYPVRQIDVAPDEDTPNYDEPQPQRVAQAGGPPRYSEKPPYTIDMRKVEAIKERNIQDLINRGWNPEKARAHEQQNLDTWLKKREIKYTFDDKTGQYTIEVPGQMPYRTNDSDPRWPGRPITEQEMPEARQRTEGGRNVTRYGNETPAQPAQPAVPAPTPQQNAPAPTLAPRAEETTPPPPMTITKQQAPAPTAAQPQVQPQAPAPTGIGATPPPQTVDWKPYNDEALRAPRQRVPSGPGYFDQKRERQADYAASAHENAKTLSNMGVAAQQAESLVQPLRVLKKIIANPDLPMGAWAPTETEAKRILVSLSDRFGMKDIFPADLINKASGQVALNDLFKKITSGGVLQSARSFLPPGSGQLRIYEIKLIEDAWPKITMDRAAAAFVADMIEKLNNRTLQEFEMAQDYASRSGKMNLDANFTKGLAAYQKAKRTFDAGEEAKLLAIGQGKGSEGTGRMEQGPDFFPELFKWGKEKLGVGGSSKNPSGNSLPSPRSEEEFSKLPSGTQFRAPDGSLRTKP